MIDLLLLVLSTLVLLWVCWGAGLLAARGLGLRGPWWFHLGAGQAALGTLWTWMILVGVFRPTLVAFTLIVIGVTGTRMFVRTNAGSTRDAPPRLPRERRANILERGMVCLFVAFCVLLACYPYQGSDFLAYQLPMAQGYAEVGGWIWFDHLRFPTFPPLMNGWFAVALMLGGRWQIQLAQLSALLPLLVLCAQLVRLTRDGEPGARPTWTLALFLGSPAVAWAGIHAYVDGAMTLFMVMAAWCVMRFIRDGGFGSEPTPEAGWSPWTWLIAAGALVGAAMNTKYLGAAFVPLLGGWLLVRWWAEGPGRKPSRLVAGSVAFGGSAFAVAGPWYLATWIRTGNPVFPFVQSIFGWAPWGWNIAPLDEIQSRPVDLLASPISWDGLSPWLLLSTVIAVWAWLRRGPRFASDRGLLLFVGLGYLLLWFLMPDDRRYLLPSLAVLSVVGAPAIETLAGRVPSLVRTSIGRAAVTGMLMLLGLAFLADQIREQGGPPPGPYAASYIEREVAGVAALAWTEHAIRPRRVYVPDLEGLRSFARTSTVVGDWSGPWSRTRLLAGIRSAQDLLERLEENEIDALILRHCLNDLRQHKLGIDRWIRNERFLGGLDFGIRASTRPFSRSTDEVPSLPSLKPREISALLDEALEVAYRDDVACVLVPRTAPPATR